MKEWVDIDDTVHDLVKVNKSLLKDGTDKYKCSGCGAMGYQTPFVTAIELVGRGALMRGCSGEEQESDFPPKKVMIILSPWTGKNHDNILIGSIHKVVISPKKKKPNTRSRVWVMGKNHPIKLLEGEFKEFKRKPKL